MPITKAFDSAFYSVLDQQSFARCVFSACLLKTRKCVHSNSLLKVRKAFVIRALNEYPRLKKTVKPVGTSLF